MSAGVCGPENRYHARMTRSMFVILLLGVSTARAGGDSMMPEPCSDDWNRYVEEELVSGDGHGHGPDLGSDEWKSVIEFRLGVRGQADVPARNSEAWCLYIDRLVRAR